MIGLDYADHRISHTPVLPGQAFADLTCVRCGSHWHAWTHPLPPTTVPACWRAPPYLCPHCRPGARIDDADGGPLHCRVRVAKEGPTQRLVLRCQDAACTATPYSATGTRLEWLPRPGKHYQRHRPLSGKRSPRVWGGRRAQKMARKEAPEP